MKADKSRIPIFQSDILQDVSIELGKRLKSIRYGASKLEFNVSRDTVTDNERFSVILWKPLRSYVQILVWEDKKARCVCRKPYLRHEKAEYMQLEAKLDDLRAEQIAQLVHDTLSGDEQALEFWRRKNASISNTQDTK